MDPKVFYDLLESPQKSDLLREELQQLVANYPWFVHGQMLYTKSLQLLNDSNYDDQLHKTSVYTQDREVLYKLITTKPESETLDAIDELIESNSFSVDPSSIKTITDSKPSLENLKEEKMVFKLTNEDSSKKKQEEIGGKEKENLRVLDDLEKGIIVEAVSRVIEQEVEEIAPEMEDPTMKIDELLEAAQPISESKEIAKKPTENLSSYAAWIMSRAHDIKYIEREPLEEKQEFEPQEFTVNESLKEKKKRLLNRFIATNPKISRGKVTEYEPGNIAEDSLKDSDFFVTETMAKIYAQQGKINKAKKTYRLLSLKYPEKSVYFAARIKNLDKK